MKKTEFAHARELAFYVLTQTPSSMLVSENLDIQLSRTSLSPADKRLAAHLVLNCVRRKGSLDTIIGCYSSFPLDTLTPAIIAVLELGIYQIRYMDKIPVFAAVNESVELARKYGSKKSAGFVNAVLREIIRNPQKLESHVKSLGPVEKMSFEESHPIWLIEHFLKVYSFEQVSALCACNNLLPQLTVRIDTRKISVHDFIERLTGSGIGCVPSAIHPDCIRLMDFGSLNGVPGYNEGWFVVQDETPVAITDMLSISDSRPLDMLDLCAAPGGKTTYLAQYAHPASRIWAVDRSEKKIAVLKMTLDRMGYTHVVPSAADAGNYESLKRLFGDTRFDVIVADVPCSNTGVLRKRAEVRWRLKENDFERLSKTQCTILKTASSFLKPSGKLLYSTCSIDPQENEQVVEQVLKLVPALKCTSRYFNLPVQPDSGDGGFGAVLTFNE